MVTASHNPAQDNGYKVYLGDGSQIVPPSDTQIAAHIAAVGSVADLALADDGWETLDDEVEEEYARRVAALVPPDAPRDLSVVHTSLHGVGNETVRRVFELAGFPVPYPVAAQADPDPDFPTVAFPNPEEAGAIDAALGVAREVHPDIVIANDPDADRCAVAVLDDGRWRMLRGDEVGALLGAHALARGVAPDALFACSIVSSRLLAAMAAAAGVRHEETLTGFKWIGRVPGLAYGYEEALGYCVAPEVVRDKDGVSAALLLAEMAAGSKAQGRTVLDVLDDLAVAHGVHATDSFSVRVADLSEIPPVMERLRSSPPAEVGRRPGGGRRRPRRRRRWAAPDRRGAVVPRRRFAGHRAGRRAPSRRSRSTSRGSSRWRGGTGWWRRARWQPNGWRRCGRPWSSSPPSDGTVGLATAQAASIRRKRCAVRQCGSSVPGSNGGAVER